MPISRRRLIQAAGGAAAAHVVVPAMARVGEAFGATGPDPASARRNRLVVIHLYGGNDGLNTVIPTSGRNYDVYRKVRPAVSYTPSQTLPIDQHLGLNPKLKTVHSLYQQGRVAVVQGVDYPDHSYSHFTSGDIWHSGEPDRAPASGWLGRHLDRVGVHEGELRGVGVGYELPLMLRGTERSGIEIASIAATRFADGKGAVADARHDALALFDHHATNEPLRRFAGHGGRQAVDLVDALAKVPAAKTTGDPLGDAMLTTRSLLGLNLGVECVFLGVGGFDTHTGQRAQHEQRLGVVDKAIEAFFLGTYGGKSLGVGALSPTLAARTIVLVMSEFGRRVGENGTGAGAGTDHGAAAPVLMLGPRNGALVAGVHGDHPSLGTTAAPADNLVMTTDVRRLYQSVLTSWLHDPDPLYERTPTLPGLFR
jgi:uncharacterized protein (DUF1501 family)